MPPRPRTPDPCHGVARPLSSPEDHCAVPLTGLSAASLVSFSNASPPPGPRAFSDHVPPLPSAPPWLPTAPRVKPQLSATATTPGKPSQALRPHLNTPVLELSASAKLSCQQHPVAVISVSEAIVPSLAQRVLLPRTLFLDSSYPPLHTPLWGRHLRNTSPGPPCHSELVRGPLLRAPVTQLSFFAAAPALFLKIASL